MNRHSLIRCFTFYVITIAVFGTLSGCSMQLALNNPKPTAPPMAAAQKESLTVVRFTDSRKTKNLLTMVGAIGIGNPKLAKQSDVGAWVARALAAELRHAGANVTVVNGSTDASTPVVVTGTVTKIFTTIYSPAMFIRTEVKFSIVVSKDGEVVLRKSYKGTASRAYFGGPGAGQDIDTAMATALQRGVLLATPGIVQASE